MVESDKVKTPEWLAKDMVEFFQPQGKILDPCCGDGVFLKYLPENAEWCEIEQGIDFFDNNEHYDWIIGNPPYSIFKDWMTHSYEIADNFIYLVPSFKLNPLSIYRMLYNSGGIKHIRLYDVGNQRLDWARSRPIVAIHFATGYNGQTGWSKF